MAPGATPGVAIVTGAGSGVGRAAALALAEAGWRVALAGRRPQALEETAALGGSDGQFLVVPTDVTDAAAVDALFEAATDRWGRVDFLFNNAGAFARQTPIEDLELETWRRMLDVNVTGTFLCAQAAVRRFKRQSPRGGRIVNNGSISAHVPRANAASYTACKHAITGLTRSLSLDGRDFDIVCGQIDIGNAATEMTRPLNVGPNAEPVMDVEHAAQAVVFMAGLPLDANVQFMTVMAAKMKYIGRG